MTFGVVDDGLQKYLYPVYRESFEIGHPFQDRSRLAVEKIEIGKVNGHTIACCGSDVGGNAFE